MLNELPEIQLTGYNSTILTADNLGIYGGGSVDAAESPFDVAAFHRHVQNYRHEIPAALQFNTQPNQGDNMNQKRIVQVFIADPDKRVPVEESLLYRGDQKLTDLTDQELFFEIDVKGSLDKHNEKRVKIVDKEAAQKAGKDVLLEPVKIRDLKMTVVVIATF